ncbi:hypothetical protein BSKO_02211 [Bryopsis sp. KO-2023]|nr:hypothetical protein BSKO_02211 [Bryopsis sp. KO-2023]
MQGRSLPKKRTGGETMPGLTKNPSFQDWISESFRKAGASTNTERSINERSRGGSVELESGLPKAPSWREFGRRQLTMIPLAAIIFYSVCGGPFGIEDSIKFGGPLAALSGLIVLPILWSVPEALVAAELSTMFPEDSGYVAWVSAAFGPFWGFVEGFCSWVSGVLDNSVYPLYLAKYFEWLFPSLKRTGPQRIFFLVASTVLTLWNYLGLTVVGRTAVVLSAIVLLPFAVMAGWAIPKINPRNWTKFNSKQFSGSFMKYLNIMFWNLNYWDSVASLTGEVKAPGKTIPKAFGIAMVMVVLGYFIPVAVGTGVLGSVVEEGYFVDLGKVVGGPFLAGWITLSATASQIGLFEAEMSSDAFLILGMAERGFLPRFMAMRSRHGTPTIGILMSSIGVVTMVMNFGFQDVVDLLNYAYCLGIALEFAAFIKLRIKSPDAARPYRIPVSTFQACLMLLPATILISILLVVPWAERDSLMIGFNVILIVSAVGTYYFLKWCRARFPQAFNPLEPVRVPVQTENNGDAEEEQQPLVAGG